MTDRAPGAARSTFLDQLEERAGAKGRTLVFPEGTEPRVRQAVAEGTRRGLFRAVVIEGAPDGPEGPYDVGTSDDVELLDADDHDAHERYSAELSEALEDRGKSPEEIEAMARDPLIQAGLLVRRGAVDGAVAGAARTTADVVRAALTVVGLAPEAETLSSAFYMVLGPGPHVGPAVLSFTDAGVVPAPDAEQLAEIAESAAAAHQRVVGEAPRVAFLSYSTKGSAEGASVDLARAALAAFAVRAPHFPADGELQADSALVAGIAERKAPGSSVAGRANVLVFPDLASANIAYKLVQYLAGAHALGPVLLGLARPYNDLSRGATVGDITAVACITALMAE